MTFADFFWFLFSVTGILVLLVLAAAWVWTRPQSRPARLFLVCLAGSFTLISLYPVPRAAVRLLAAGFHPLTQADVPPGRTVVVLLGSGTRTRLDWSGRAMSVQDVIGLERTLEAARVYRLVGADYIISSGGKFEGDPNDPAGSTMKSSLVDLGVPADKVIVERESRTTHEQALLIARLISTLETQNVVLVTSPVHMRRAMGVFRAAGVTAIPAIAREPTFADWPVTLLPSLAGLGLSALVVHEVAGLVYYRARGWSR